MLLKVHAHQVQYISQVAKVVKVLSCPVLVSDRAGSIPASTERGFIAVFKEQRTTCQAAYRELWGLEWLNIIVGLLQNVYAVLMVCCIV